MRLSDLGILLEAKKQQSVKNPAVLPQSNNLTTPPKVTIEDCPMFRQSIIEKAKSNPLAINKLKDFIKFKFHHPLEMYGKSDKSGGSLFEGVPRLRHAHLTFDISIWYSVIGTHDKTIRLYGIFTHDESGTGQPVKPKKAAGLATQMTSQVFEPSKFFNPVSDTQN